MVPGWTGRHEGDVTVATAQGVDDLEGGPGRQAGRCPTIPSTRWCRGRCAPPPAAQKARNVSRYDTGWTRLSSSMVARRGSRAMTASRRPASSMPARAAGDAGRAFGMMGPDVVMVERGRRRQEEHRPHCTAVESSHRPGGGCVGSGFGGFARDSSGDTAWARPVPAPRSTSQGGGARTAHPHRACRAGQRRWSGGDHGTAHPVQGGCPGRGATGVGSSRSPRGVSSIHAGSRLGRRRTRGTTSSLGAVGVAMRWPGARCRASSATVRPPLGSERRAVCTARAGRGWGRPTRRGACAR